MSRMPVREAFRRLASDGLVVLRPNRGCIVAGLTLDELYEAFEMPLRAGGARGPPGHAADRRGCA